VNQFDKRIEAIEALLDEWLPEHPDRLWMDRVFQGPGVSPEAAEALTRPGRDLVKRGGKRWRPLLMILIAEGLGGYERALRLCPMVELAHNASLIHDDIEDRSEERRGKPAVHILYGEDTAINAGSFLYFLSLACLSRWDGPGELKGRLFEVWGDHLARLHLGQAMDIAWHRDLDALPSLGEYDRMCRLKTGCLARLAAVLGVLGAQTSGPPFPEAEALALHLGEAAESLGVGFQILDDVKNLTVGVPGKKRGDDLVEGKKSLPVLLYLQGNPGGRERMGRCFRRAREGGTEVPEVEEFICSLEEAGVLEEAARRGRCLITQSRETLGRVGDLPEESRRLLAALADSMIT